MIELRWFKYYDKEGDPEKVLQYRVYEEVTDYKLNATNSDWVKYKKWSEWKTVPTVEG